MEVEEAGRETLVSRMVGAARLDPAIYRALASDTGATAHAGGVVVVAGVASVIGAPEVGITGIPLGVMAGLLGWILWSTLIYLIGDKLLGGTATWGELLRVLGFAQTPGILYVFAFLPGGVFLRTLLSVWIIVAVVVAIREALEFSTGKAVLTAALGFMAMVLLTALLLIPTLDG